MSHNSKLTKEQHKEIITKYIVYLVGCTTLAKQYGVSEQSVEKFLKRRGLLRPKKLIILTDNEKEFIKLNYIGNKGKLSLSKISEHLNLGMKTVKKYLIKENIPIISDHRIRAYELKEDYFDVIDSSNKAYILGLVCADGCLLDRNRVIIELSSKDNHILYEIAAAMLKDPTQENIDSMVYTYIRPDKEYRSYTRIVFNRVKIGKCLKQYNITPRKSLTLQFPDHKLLGKFMPDFIRGYFDGDGGIQINKGNLKNGSYALIARPTFTGTFSYIKNIFKILKLEGIIAYGIRQAVVGKNCFRLSIHHNKSAEIVGKYIYYNNDMIKMDRKYNRFVELEKYNNLVIQQTIAGTQGYSYKRYFPEKSITANIKQLDYDIVINKIQNGMTFTEIQNELKYCRKAISRLYKEYKNKNGADCSAPF